VPTTAQSRRSELITLVAIGVWILVLVFGWALRPIDDSVPVIIDPDSALAGEVAENPAARPSDAPRAVTVECNALVESTAMDGAVTLPDLPPEFVYEREPCQSPWTQARWTAAVNVLALIVVIVLWRKLSAVFRLDLDPAPTRSREPSSN
jgi:hypothetical protein